MAYNRKYVHYFCSVSNKPSELYFLKKEDDEDDADPTIVQGTETPVIIDQKDQQGIITKPINGLDIELSLIASGDFTAQSLFTEDEDEWRVDLFIDGDLSYSGFLLPEANSEPYAIDNYEIRLRATSVVNSLDQVAYYDEFGVYRGFDSDKDILFKCLNKTGLILPIWIGVNTFESHMTDVICPLVQSEIEQERFLDQNGTPFSCYEVIRSILERYGAQLWQMDGKWVVINTLERSLGAVNYWKFGADGSFIEAEEIDREIQVDDPGQVLTMVKGTDEIIRSKAIKSSLAYYQYGFTTNAIENGDFNEFSIPNILPDNWVAVGAVVASTGVSTVTNPSTGEVIETGHYLIVTSANLATGAYVENQNAVTVRASQNVVISFDMFVPSGITPTVAYVLKLALRDASGNYFTKDGWKAQGASYDIDFPGAALDENVKVSFEIPYAIGDYQLFIDFAQVYRKSNNAPFVTHYDNLTFAIGVSDSALTPPVGKYVRLTQPKKLTTVPDPIVILHGDEPIDLRTSQIKVGGAYTTAWTRKGIEYDGNAEASPLLFTIADSLLRINGRPRRVLSAKFNTALSISPMTVIDVPLLDGKFAFVSGKLNIAKESYDLILSEIFRDEVEYFTPYEQAEDNGQLTDKDGKSVGTPTGVVNPPPAQFPTDDFVRKWETWDSDLEVTGETTTRGIRPLEFMEVPTVEPDAGDMIPGKAYVWIDLSGTGGGGTPPVVVVNLTDLQDVAISSPTNGQALTYNSGTGKWVNSTITVDLSGYYTKTEINAFFAGTAGITGYNKSNWDSAYGTVNAASAVTSNNTLVKRDANGRIQGANFEATDTAVYSNNLASITGKYVGENITYQFNKAAVQAFIDINNGTTLINSVTGNSGTVTNGVYTNGSYSNPAWITALAWSKITGTPATLAGYGITDAVPSSRTVNGKALSSNISLNLQDVTNVSGTTTVPLQIPYFIFPGSAGGNSFEQGSDITGWHVYDNTANAYRMAIANNGAINFYNGAATFGGTVTVNNDFTGQRVKATTKFELPVKNTGGTVTGIAEIWIEV